MGKLKCLAILGVRMNQLEACEDLTLSHKDVEVIGLYPTEKSTGKFVEEAYEDSAKRIGGDFLANVLDQGSDIKMGARLFQQKHPKVKLLHDISHKLSNIMEHELTNDKNWSVVYTRAEYDKKKGFSNGAISTYAKKTAGKGKIYGHRLSCELAGSNQKKQRKWVFKKYSRRTLSRLFWLD